MNRDEFEKLTLLISKLFEESRELDKKFAEVQAQAWLTNYKLESLKQELIERKNLLRGGNKRWAKRI
jgi:hypothetical protein